MIIKETQPFNALVYRVETTLPQLQEYTKHIAEDMYDEAARLGLTVTDPINWNYYGIDGQPETVFTLEIALPIQEKDVKTERFEWKQVEGFKCISTTHEGSWERLPQTYEMLIKELHAKGLTVLDNCREIYTKVDFENCENNSTEVQLGVG